MARAIDMIDAPVSGGAAVAETGGLSNHKDIHIVIAMAEQLGIELPASNAAAKVLTELQNRGGGKSDTAAVFSVLDKP